MRTMQWNGGKKFAPIPITAFLMLLAYELPGIRVVVRVVGMMKCIEYQIQYEISAKALDGLEVRNDKRQDTETGMGNRDNADD